MPDPLDSQALLPRPQLTDSLKKGLAGRATLLVAPAGYGKTSVVSAFAGSVDVPVIWCIFKPKDSGVRPFARRILQAVEMDVCGANSETPETASVDVKPRQQLRAALAELATASTSKYCVLVLEDYHYVATSDEVNELTSELLEELPSEIHLIITSRVCPEIRQLPKMITQQQVSVLDASDLAFSSEEVAAFLRLTTGSSPSDEQVRELFDATRGWPACVALLGTHQIPYSAIDQESSGLYAYFAGEILKCLPSQVARFMLQTSVLPLITAGLGDELQKRSDSAAFIAQLRTGRLLQPSPDRRGAYEYHPLMREFLLAHLRADSPVRYEELHINAADLFRQHGSLDESVELLTAVEAWSRLAELLEEVSPDLLNRGAWDMLCQWLDRLPHDLLVARERLVLLRSKLAYLQGEPSRALQLLAAREEILQSPQGIIAKALALSLQGQNRQSIRLARQGLDLARKASDTDTVAEAQLCLGVTQAVKASYPSAQKSLRAALRHFLGKGDLYGQSMCYIHLAGIYHFQGRVDEEIASLEAGARIWRKLGNSERLARALNNLGVSHHKRGNHESALTAFTDCLQLAQRLEIAIEEAYCLVGLADLLRDESNLGRAERLYERGIALAKELGERVLYVYALAGQADLKRLEGVLDDAEAIAKQALIEAVDHNNPQEEGICLTVLGSIYRDLGKLQDGIAVLERACRLLQEAECKIEVAKARFLLASTLFRLRQRSRPMKYLEEVVEIIHTVGHDRFILPLVRDDPPLIQYAVAKRRSGYPFSQWLARVAAHVHRAQRGADLSERTPEVEVRGLGDLVVLVNGMPISDLAWQTTKAKEMFLYLVVNRGPALKEEIVEALWPDLPSPKSSSYFHSNLHRMRQALYHDCVLHDGPRYLLNPEGVFRSDVIDFLDRVESCRGKRTSLKELRRAVSLYSGSFTSEVYSDWAVALQRQLEDQYLWVLDRLLEHTMRSGEHAEVATLCEKILEVDPFHEFAWKELIHYHQSSGHLGVALRLYRECTDVFVRELGTEVPGDIARLMRPAQS